MKMINCTYYDVIFDEDITGEIHVEKEAKHILLNIECIASISPNAVTCILGLPNENSNEEYVIDLYKVRTTIPYIHISSNGYPYDGSGYGSVEEFYVDEDVYKVLMKNINLC